jgi:RHS repeat-associated protein
MDASVLVQTSAKPIVYQRLLANGGYETYAQSDGATGYPRRIFLTQIVDSAGQPLSLNYDSRLRLTSITDATQRSTRFTYAGQSFLVTQITDPFGRFAKFSYDSSGRLISITDVLGLMSTFIYDPTNPNANFIKEMDTPYGATTFTTQDIPDKSSHPVGMSTCQNSANSPLPCNSARVLSATDPLGHTEYLLFAQELGFPAFSEPGAGAPNLLSSGIPVVLVNGFLDERNTYFWDKHAYAVAPPCFNSDGTLCQASTQNPVFRITHWLHEVQSGVISYVTAPSIESIKYPLENRIWFAYPGEVGGNVSGTLNKPAAIARFSDDGETQLTKITYNDFGRIASIIDPIGRQTSFTYDPGNEIDLTVVSQGSQQIASLASYNSQHRPLTYTDAAGQTVHYMYNGAGQLTQITDPLNETTTFNYDPSTRFLTSIVNANDLTQASFTPDAFARVLTRTDSESYTVTYQYDALDRLSQETYPDGTTRVYTWSNLDLHMIKDRQGKTTIYDHDAVRNLSAVTDPLGNKTRFDYWENGKLKSLTDPNGNVTTWCIDVEGRVSEKHYPDGQPFTCNTADPAGHHSSLPANTIQYKYDATSRLKSLIDAAGETKQYTYALDDRVTCIDYINPPQPTPNVRFTYDPVYPRIIAMADGSDAPMGCGSPEQTFSHSYKYWPVGVGSLGALQLMDEVAPDARVVSYQYDGLGRLKGRTVDGDTESFTYDPIGRLSTNSNDLGHFLISYLGQTPQVMGLHSLSSPVRTDWSYDTNLNDRRLLSITNRVPARSYAYATEAENLISSVTETVSGTTTRHWSYLYDDDYRLRRAGFSAGSTLGYLYDGVDNLTEIFLPAVLNSNFNTIITPKTANEINTVRVPGSAVLPGPTFRFQYDANGNLTEDDLRFYQWDGDNCLVLIYYKQSNGQRSANRTTFQYDGLGRRVGITEFSVTASGVTSVQTAYRWCGDVLCEASQQTAGPTRRYFMQGENHPAQGRGFYYAKDHLGSIRDLLDSRFGQRLQCYDFGAFGTNLGLNEIPAFSSDFRYAGMFYHVRSGLYLTRYRAYDPRYARWLSRDSLGEFSHIRNPSAPEKAVRIMPGPSSAGSVFQQFQSAALPQSTASPGNFYTSSANLYTYVANNPVTYTDPSGLDFSSCFDECFSELTSHTNIATVVGIIPGVNVGAVLGGLFGCAARCTLCGPAGCSCVFDGS